MSISSYSQLGFWVQSCWEDGSCSVGFFSLCFFFFVTITFISLHHVCERIVFHFGFRLAVPWIEQPQRRKNLRLAKTSAVRKPLICGNLRCPKTSQCWKTPQGLGIMETRTAVAACLWWRSWSIIGASLLGKINGILHNSMAKWWAHSRPHIFIHWHVCAYTYQKEYIHPWMYTLKYIHLHLCQWGWGGGLHTNTLPYTLPYT